MNVIRRSEAGLATLEMALVLPFLLFVLFAIVEFGLAFARLQVVQNAAREGARAAVLFRSPCNAGIVTTAVNDAIQPFQGSLGMGAFNVVIQPEGGGDACTANFIRVNVSFQHPIPLSNGLARFFGSLPTSVPLNGASAAARQQTRTSGS
jgi:Flp pilus assembly protein TadG